jgi:glycosyltransferase involved in cell wall biosynthesis
MAEITLLMPFCNSATFISDAVLSLQNQSFKDWELIAVNDFSPDASESILRQFAHKDSRIKIHQNQEKGILPALQLAFSKATGKFVGRFDSDDFLPPDRLQLMRAKMQNAPPKTIVTGMVEYFGDHAISKGYLQYQTWLNSLNQAEETWKEIYRECVIASPNWLMRRLELLAIGGFSGLQYPEDYDWCFRCYLHNFKVISVPAITLQWREHANRTSRNSVHYQQAAFFTLKLNRFLEIETYRQIVLWGTGRKARITAAFFLKKKIQFLWMDVNPQRFPGGIFDQPLLDYRDLQASPGLKLLVGVYPNPSERMALEAFLLSRHLVKGQNYWYL